MKLLFQSAGNSHASAEHKIGMQDDGDAEVRIMKNPLLVYNHTLIQWSAVGL